MQKDRQSQLLLPDVRDKLLRCPHKMRRTPWQVLPRWSIHQRPEIVHDKVVRDINTNDREFLSKVTPTRKRKLTDRSNYVGTKKSVCLLISKDFNEAIGLSNSLGAAVGDERKFADVVFHSLNKSILLWYMPSKVGCLLIWVANLESLARQ